jgi:hypothetical protein
VSERSACARLAVHHPSHPGLSIGGTAGPGRAEIRRQIHVSVAHEKEDIDIDEMSPAGRILISWLLTESRGGGGVVNHGSARPTRNVRPAPR